MWCGSYEGMCINVGIWVQSLLHGNDYIELIDDSTTNYNVIWQITFITQQGIEHYPLFPYGTLKGFTSLI